MLSSVIIATALLVSGPQTHDIDPPAAPGSVTPHLVLDPQRRPVLSWVEPEGSGHALKYSVWDEHRWQSPRKVSAGNDWFVNWADFPSVQPVTDTLWAAHWLRRSGDAPYAYDVVIALSRDAGLNWSAGFTPHRDGTATEHGFASLFAVAGGVGAVWLDGRNTAGHQHGADGEGSGAMTLRYARMGAGGDISEGYLVDGRVCDCCQTDVAATADGLIAVFRDRSQDEIRDISASLWRDGRWTDPKPVSVDHWNIAGCPVNGPAVAADSQRIVVAWYTEAGESREVRSAWSIDGGESFLPYRLVDDQQPLGRVDVALDDQGRGWVSWLRQQDDGKATLMLRSLHHEDGAGTEHKLADTLASRPSGFPQLAIRGGEAWLAWTDAGADHTRIRAARYSLNDGKLVPIKAASN